MLTTDFGYYPLRLPRSEIVDRTLSIVYHGRDSSDVQRVFVGEERLGSAGSLRLGALNSALSCKVLEIGLADAQGRLDSLRAVGAGSVLARVGRRSTGPALAGLTSVLTALLKIPGMVAGPPANGGPAQGCVLRLPDGTPVLCAPDSTTVRSIDLLPPSDGETRSLVALALGPLSQNGGFGFSPSRDVGAGSLFGATATTGSGKGRAAVQTDFDRFARVSALIPVGNRAGLSVGYFRFQETRAITRLTADGAPVGTSVDRSFALASLGGALQTSAGVSWGVSGKYIHQVVGVATAVERTSVYWSQVLFPGRPVEVTNRLLSREVGKDAIDFDLSVLFQGVGGLQLGLGVLNVLVSRI